MVHDRVHNSPPLVPILSHNNSEHALASCFFKIHFNIIPSTPRTSKCSVSFIRLHQLYAFLFYPIRATRPVHLILLPCKSLSPHRTLFSNLLAAPPPHCHIFPPAPSYPHVPDTCLHTSQRPITQQLPSLQEQWPCVLCEVRTECLTLVRRPAQRLYHEYNLKCKDV
jgi:hypothetical protein